MGKCWAFLVLLKWYLPSGFQVLSGLTEGPVFVLLGAGHGAVDQGECFSGKAPPGHAIVMQGVMLPQGKRGWAMNAGELGRCAGCDR